MDRMEDTAITSGTGALVQASSPVPGLAPHGLRSPIAGCRPADFNDEYRASVCKIGQGAECCRYVTMGAKGWGCEKRTSMAWAIDSRIDKMTAKGNNCDGVYEIRPAYRLTAARFDYPAGTIIYPCASHDYGCASDDAAVTGQPHTSMTLEPSGDYPLFTVPNADFEPVEG